MESDGNIFFFFNFQEVEMASGITTLGWKNKCRRKADVAYSRGKGNIIAQHKLQYAYTHFHVDGWLPSHLNIMSS